MVTPDPLIWGSRGLIVFFSKPMDTEDVWPISASDKPAGNEH